MESTLRSEKTAAVAAALSDIANPVLFFPVRHHSPAAALLLRQAILARRPRYVLIEGPADYNPQLQELYLEHRLPLAIYSYIELEDGTRHAVYYPFCIYSPEWQALLAAKEVGAEARFIDLPLAEQLPSEDATNRYSDARFMRPDFLSVIAKELGVDDFAAAWDTLFELPEALTLPEYLRQAHFLGVALRALDGSACASDQQREAYMAAQLRGTLARGDSAVVVTGAYHSLALYEQLSGSATSVADAEPKPSSAPLQPARAALRRRGLALTPYTYARLDRLTGYNAGMPHPGFYHRLWEDRRAGRSFNHRRILKDCAQMLRERKQLVSVADLIGIESMAQGLARIRDHALVWRTDLRDAAVATLVKDALPGETLHPLPAAIDELWRGDARGRLAVGTKLPPLVLEVERLLEQYSLDRESVQEKLVNLEVPEELALSRLLHQLALLELPGMRYVGGTDFLARQDLSHLWERWQIAWSPDSHAALIEAARYGASLHEALGNVLRERMLRSSASLTALSELLLSCVRAGLDSLSSMLEQTFCSLIRAQASFTSLTHCLSSLLYLYRYDSVLGTRGQQSYGRLLEESFDRALSLLERVGMAQDSLGEILSGIEALGAAYDLCHAELRLSPEEYFAVLQRVLHASGTAPGVAGAVLGLLWTAGKADAPSVAAALRLHGRYSEVGDFLTGLCTTAKEGVYHTPALMQTLHELTMQLDHTEFLSALPALRLAFSVFSPREKHYLLRHLPFYDAQAGTALLNSAGVSAAEGRDAYAFEMRLMQMLKRFGIRGVAGE